ncbi:MAG: GGDEF domain-containing protein [Myxococcaceae bacterium]|nr:GGDEF domain-containing protein [Myxococcaceae bacterium]MCI0669684.1 GGDEF domain-containing protein [Myxococcaceae bacterium]
MTEVDLPPVALAAQGRPAPSLVVIAGDECKGRVFRLESGELLLGRASDAHIRLEGTGISRHHARLHCYPDGTVELEDLGSRNGTWVRGKRVLHCQLRDGDKVQVGQSTLLKLAYQDPLELAFQEALYASATRDGLTGALNKKSFGEALQREFSFSMRHGGPLSLALVDVDHFKRINDAHGHLAGDAVLARLGEALRALTRAEDVFARVGGEEFAFLLRDCRHEDALAIAERVCHLVQDTAFVVGGARLSVSVSVGVATLLPTLSSPEALVAAADHALYEAKARGRNRVVSAEHSAAA